MSPDPRAKAQNDLIEKVCAPLLAEIERLNKWADGFSDAQIKERQTGEAYQRELRERAEKAEREAQDLARECADWIKTATELRAQLEAAQKGAERYRNIIEEHLGSLKHLVDFGK